MVIINRPHRKHSTDAAYRDKCQT